MNFTFAAPFFPFLPVSEKLSSSSSSPEGSASDSGSSPKSSSESDYLAFFLLAVGFLAVFF